MPLHVYPFCRRAALALASLLLPGSLVLAQEAPASSDMPPLDRFSLRVGGYASNVDTRVTASDKSGFLSGSVDLEDDLGFRRNKQEPRVRADVLLGEHEGLALDYYTIDRASDHALVRDGSYDGFGYHVDADVHSRLDFDFGSAAWRWWYGQGNDAYGLGLGGAWYRVRTAVAGNGSVDLGLGLPDVQPFDSTSNDRAWAPMLQLGWRHAFNDQWRLYLDASGIRKNGGRLSGHIYNGSLGVEWLPWPHLGFGAEYDYSQIRLDWRRSHYNAVLDMSLSGPSAYVKLRF